jgi:hypothetical protein
MAAGAPQGTALVTVDFKSLRSLENMRGVFYVLAICSVISPALLSIYITDFQLLKEHTVVAVILALAVGFLCTALFTLSVFIDGLTSSFLSRRGRMRSGTSALAIGPLLSLLLQCAALAGCAYYDHNFRTYILLSTVLPVGSGVHSLILFVRALRKAERATAESGRKLAEISARREELAKDMDVLETMLVSLDNGTASEADKEEIVRRFVDVRARAMQRDDLDAMSEELKRIRRSTGMD